MGVTFSTRWNILAEKNLGRSFFGGICWCIKILLYQMFILYATPSVRCATCSSVKVNRCSPMRPRPHMELCSSSNIQRHRRESKNQYITPFYCSISKIKIHKDERSVANAFERIPDRNTKGLTVSFKKGGIMFLIKEKRRTAYETCCGVEETHFKCQSAEDCFVLF